MNDAYARGVGAAIYSPLAGGVLTDAMISGADRHPLARPPDTASASYRRFRQMAQALSFLRHEGTSSLSQAAIRFILMTQGVTVVLGGFSAMSHVEAIAAVSGSAPLAPELIARIEQVWRDNFGIAMEVNDHAQP